MVTHEHLWEDCTCGEDDCLDLVCVWCEHVMRSPTAVGTGGRES